MSKHAWKDEAIAMKIAGASMQEIADKFSVPYHTVVNITRGTKSTHSWPARGSDIRKPHTTCYQGSEGHIEKYRKQHAVRFIPDLFDDINAYAREKDMSFSSAVASLAAKALSDIRSEA